MDSLDKRKVEMTIEVRCIGLDETLEKTSKLVELLKEAEAHEMRITMDHKVLAQTICDKGPEAQEQSCS